MAEFLQSYGIWIFAGLLLILMFVGRGRGMGCGMGGHQHTSQTDSATENKDGQQSSKGHNAGCH